MKPMLVPPGPDSVPLGPISTRVAVENTAPPDVPPTTFSVSLEGEHSEYLPGQEVAPGRYWLHGVAGPVTGSLENLGPSTLKVYVDAEPEALPAQPAPPAARGVATGCAGGRRA
jgi:hypothetical protein